MPYASMQPSIIIADSIGGKIMSVRDLFHLTEEVSIVTGEGYGFG